MFSKIYEENNFSGQIGFKNLKSFNNNIKNKNKTFNKIITNLSNQKFNFFDNCIAQKIQKLKKFYHQIFYSIKKIVDLKNCNILFIKFKN